MQEPVNSIFLYKFFFRRDKEEYFKHHKISYKISSFADSLTTISFMLSQEKTNLYYLLSCYKKLLVSPENFVKIDMPGSCRSNPLIFSLPKLSQLTFCLLRGELRILVHIIFQN